MERHVFALNVYRTAAALRHFKAVAQQGKTGHVSTAVDAVLDHDVAGCLVQRSHLAVDTLHHSIRNQTGLGSSGQYPHTQRLCQHQHIAGFGAAVGQNLFRMDKAGHGKSIDRLCAVDRMPAGNDSACLIGFIVAAPQQLLYHFRCHGLRQAQNVQGQLRFTTHGIYIADGVSRSDLPIEKRVIYNGRKEIGGLHQRCVLVQIVDTGIV